MKKTENGTTFIYDFMTIVHHKHIRCTYILVTIHVLRKKNLKIVLIMQYAKPLDILLE